MNKSVNLTPPRLMPAEWEPHGATWISWPHHEPDWPGKLAAIEWVYTEMVRVIGSGDRVEIICHDAEVEARARDRLDISGVNAACYRLHRLPTDRGWLRDSGPTGVRTSGGQMEWIHWRFTAWAKYDNFERDQAIPRLVQQVTGWNRVEAMRPDGAGRLVLEGGSIDTDGAGTLLTTEECLLSHEQERNPGLTRERYEQAFAEYLGIRKTIWLDRGVAGDDTHGHVDDIARFVAPATVVLAYEADPAEEFHEASVENLRRLEATTDADGRRLRVVKLPMPHPVMYEGQRLPASYANFYIANGLMAVPTFNDPNDRVVLGTLADLFPGRKVVGIHAVDLVLGQGTLHCLTQQQPI